MNDEVYLHLHVNICNAEHHSFGGHLTKALVSVTFEGVIELIDGDVDREFDKNTGMNLLHL
jgi:predicted DNA-binding protein with PD1-like motif